MLTDHLVKVISRHLFESLNATHPDIVDEDIDAAIVSLEALEGRYHGVEIGDVADERFCQTAGIDSFLRGFIGEILPNVLDNDRSA
jgi:hypothetical protein